MFKQLGDKYSGDQRTVQRFVKSSLPDRYNSCVRQLLNSGMYDYAKFESKSISRSANGKTQ